VKEAAILKFHFPLTYVVSVSPFSGQSRLIVCYDKRYFSSESIGSMAEEYITILKKMSR